MKSVRTKKPKKTNKDNTTTLSQRKVKAKKDKPKEEEKKNEKPDKNDKKKDASMRSLRKKKKKKQEKTKEMEEIQAPDEDANLKENRPEPPQMRNPTPEQTKAYEEYVKQTLELGVEGMLKEYVEQLRPYVCPNIKREIFDQNAPKNRYRDVVCNDNTRVVLNDGKPGDYIHANFVKGDPLYNEFICTQGPTQATIIDFWRMIVHCKVLNIIMLCEVVENGKTKCDKYWPAEVGAKLMFGDISVKTVSIVTKDQHVTRTHLSVECGTYKATVRHHHWKTWPDKSVPKSSLCTLRILQAVRCSPKPVVVHCSAGIGRTGTLVAVEMCLQQLLTTHSLPTLEVCKKLRDCRHSAVQVDVQYVYLAQVVIEYGRAMGFWSNEDLQEEYSKFKTEFDTFITKRTEEEQGQGKGGAAAPEPTAPPQPPTGNSNSNPESTDNQTPAANPAAQKEKAPQKGSAENNA